MKKQQELWSTNPTAQVTSVDHLLLNLFFVMIASYEISELPHFYSWTDYDKDRFNGCSN